MNTKSFTLIEIIFSILIIAILYSSATNYFTSTLDHSTKIKIKNTILNIQLGINSYKNKKIFKGEDIDLDSLDDNSNELFSKVLSTPVLSSKNSWEKVSDLKYVYHLKNEDLEFFYEPTTYIFSCDKSVQLCKEILQ